MNHVCILTKLSSRFIEVIIYFQQLDVALAVNSTSNLEQNLQLS